MVRILLTGASGLLGSHLLPLLAGDHQVYSVGRTSVPTTEKMPPIDLANSWSTEGFPKSIDTVIHLAQSPRYRDFPQGAEEVFNVNSASTAKLLEYARTARAQRLILASTGGIYRSGASPVTEDSELLGPAELGHYFSTKLAAEMIAGNYRQFMDVHVMRIFFMFGPGQKRDMFLPSLVGRISRREPVQLNGENGICINPVHAMNAAMAVKALAVFGGPKTINIAGQQALTIREIANEIGSHLRQKPSFEHLPKAKDLVADTTALASLIGSNQHNFLSSLQDLVTEYGTISKPGEQNYSRRSGKVRK